MIFFLITLKSYHHIYKKILVEKDIYIPTLPQIRLDDLSSNELQETWHVVQILCPPFSFRARKVAPASNSENTHGKSHSLPPQNHPSPATRRFSTNRGRRKWAERKEKQQLTEASLALPVAGNFFYIRF